MIHFSSKAKRGRRGFSLIELLVVIAIIAILVSLLMASVQKAREAASRVACMNNLKQLGVAMHLYHDDNNLFPMGYYPANSGQFTYTGWQLQLLPYLEQSSLWERSVTYLAANPSNTDSNAFPACGFPMKIFVCPSNTRPLTDLHNGVTYEVTSYMGNAGTSSNNPVSGDGILCSGTQHSIGEILDGTSNTIAVGERPCTGDLYAGWGFAPFGFGQGDGDTLLGSRDTSLAANMGDLPTNIGLRKASHPTDTAELDGAHYWSFHIGGANFLFCDGSVQYLLYSADSVLPALCTRAGGENVVVP